MTKAEAKRLCLIKWKHAMDTGCSFVELWGWLKLYHVDIYHMAGMCAYCDKYNKYDMCDGCPLFERWGFECAANGSPWDKWYFAKTKRTRKKYATIIYNDIKAS